MCDGCLKVGVFETDRQCKGLGPFSTLSQIRKRSLPGAGVHCSKVTDKSAGD